MHDFTKGVSAGRMGYLIAYFYLIPLKLKPFPYSLTVQIS